MANVSSKTRKKQPGISVPINKSVLRPYRLAIPHSSGVYEVFSKVRGKPENGIGSIAINKHGYVARGSNSSMGINGGIEFPQGKFQFDGLVELTTITVVIFNSLAYNGGAEYFLWRLDQDNNPNVAQIALDYFYDGPGVFRLRPLVATSATSGWAVAVDTTHSEPAIGVPYVIVTRWISGNPIYSSLSKMGSKNLSWASGSLSPTGSIGVVGGGLSSNMTMHILGSAYTGSLAWSPDADVLLSAWMPYKVDDKILLKIIENPWCIFTPKNSEIYSNLQTLINRRALYWDGNIMRQISDGLIGTGKKPIVLLNDTVKERATSEGVPIILKNGQLSTLNPSSETLVI